MRTRRDWRKYRSELFKYDPLIAAALEREGDFLATSRWSFYVIGAEDRIIADARFGWGGITEHDSKPMIEEIQVCLDDPGLEDIVQEKIDALYQNLPWLPVLPVRYLLPDDYYDETRLPHLDGWYDGDTGKIHYCTAFQQSRAMPMLESRCGKVSGSYDFFGDPLPYVEPEFAGEVCKTCIRLSPTFEIREPEKTTASIEIQIHLADNQTCDDAFSRIREGVERYGGEAIQVEYIHVEIVGARYSVLLANECAEQIRQYCHEHYPEIEAYVIFV